VHVLAVVGPQGSKSRLGKLRSLFQHRVEDRDEIAGGGIDDLEDFGGGGLLFQSLARLGDEPRVLHGDDCLRREIFQQRDLSFGERPDFLAVGAKNAQNDVVPEQGHVEERAHPAKLYARNCERIAASIRSLQAGIVKIQQRALATRAGDRTLRAG
jgi:hypothetical protein